MSAENLLSVARSFLDEHLPAVSSMIERLAKATNVAPDVVMLALASAILGIVMVSVLFSKRPKGKKIPCVQGGYPFFGQVFDMINGSPWDVMTKWVAQYGKIYKFHLFGSDAIVIADPELLKVVLNTRMSLFKKDLEWTYRPFLVILGNGLVTADGASWKKQRLLLSSHLRVNILDLIPAMALKSYQRLSKKLDGIKSSGSTIEMAEEFRHMTLQVIAEAVLSLTPEESDQTFATMYLPIVEEGNLRTWHPEREYILNSAWFKFRKDVKVLNDYVTGLIRKRWDLRKQEAIKISRGEEVTRVPDILDKTLGDISDAEWNDDTVRQIRDEVKTFILAGHETSASMLTWSLYELSIAPEKLQRVYDEAHAVFKNYYDMEKRTITSLPPKSELDKLVYAECCLREALRKYSNVPTVVRKAAETVEVGEYVITKGSTIMVGMQGVHHNPEFWPEPLQYRPERFLEPIKPYTFIPFIEGPRMCLGQFLSLLESKIVLSLLILSYKFELTNRENAGEKHPFMVPIIPKVGHIMKIH